MDPAPASETSDTRDIVRRLLQGVLSIVATGVLLFAPAGTLRWPFAWLYLGASVAVILFLVAGLDHRFGWSGNVPAWLSAVGLAAFVGGSALVSWAMMSNRFFSTQVRIQHDRGHEVCTTGPYRFVRHPGYLGMIVYQLVTPLIFASWWCFIPATLTAAIFALER